MFFIGLATLNTGKLSAILTDIQGLGFQNIFNRSWQQQWGAGLDTQRVLDLETVDSRFPLCHNLCYSGNIALVTYYYVLSGLSDCIQRIEQCTMYHPIKHKTKNLKNICIKASQALYYILQFRIILVLLSSWQ